MHYGKAAGTFEASRIQGPDRSSSASNRPRSIGLHRAYPWHLSQVAAALAIVVLLGASYAIVKINGFNWRWQKMDLNFHCSGLWSAP